MNASALSARGCASCPASVCPTCSVGQMCQQLFRPALDCSSCPVNICVADPSYRAPSRSAPIGGAVGGALGALALSAVGLALWRMRKRRERERQRQIRLDAKVRAAEGEQFRPKRSSKGSAAASASAASRGVEEEEEEEAEDVEWTQMRPDGLTTFVSPPGAGNEEEVTLDMAALGAGADAGMKRRSTGAATHLSRITEGAEEDEERKRLSMLSVARSANARYGSRAPPVPTSRPGGANEHARVGSSSAISLSPAVQAQRASYISTSGLSGVSGVSAQQHYAAGNSNPFADGASIRSASSGGTHIIPILFSPPGSAVPSPSIHSGHSEQGVDATYDAGGGGAPLSPPARAARATGAPLIQLSHGRSEPQRAGSHPARPNRAPDLNLRLHETSPSGVRLPLSSPTHDFRNVDPSTQPNFPSALAASNVYSRSDRPLSTASGMSVATAATGATSATTATTNYARANHQLHSLAEGGGVKRVQLGRAAAQLVRTPSAARRAAAAGGSSPRNERADPFSDIHSPTSPSPSGNGGGGGGGGGGGEAMQAPPQQLSASQRPQSQASSIAGLSVFDGIPFMHSPTEPMPLPPSPSRSAVDPQEQLRTPTSQYAGGKRTPSPSGQSTTRKEMVATGAKADVESLRLQHELDAFPFRPPTTASPTSSRS